jgi:hypothetical protein
MVSFVLPFIFIILLLLVISFFMTERGKEMRSFVHFYTTGLDSGFKMSQILFLAKIGKETGLEDRSSLFWSVQALDRCIAEIVRRTRQTGSENEADTQKLLSRLYAYRTQVELEQSKKKHGLDSTKDIAAGQRIRILLRGVGVFSSKVLRNNLTNLALEYPKGTPNLPASSVDWKSKTLSIYFWRHEDAGYVFDTITVPDPASEGKAILHVAHSNKLIRSQKRKSVRAKCSVYAQMYLIKPGDSLDDTLEPEPGMKCLIEDLSEDGAMIVIGGKAIKDMQLKIQFMIHDVLIVMAGVIRGFEFNQETNQSRIHFECGQLNSRMKNAILTFVYNVLPEEEKEIFDAIRLTEEDDRQESVSGEEKNESALPDMPDFIRKK